VHVGGAGLPRQRDGRAILAGDRDHFRFGIGIEQLVADRRDLHVERRRPGMLRGVFAEVLVPLVLGRIDPLARLLVEPIIADHPMLIRVSARQQRGMTGRRLGRRVAVVIVAVPSAAIEQEPEALFAVEIVVFDQLLLRQAIDHHEQHQLRRRLAGRAASRLGGGSKRDQQPRAQHHRKEGATDRHCVPLSIRRLVLGS
jgi:hypothetical protein